MSEIDLTATLDRGMQRLVEETEKRVAKGVATWIRTGQAPGTAKMSGADRESLSDAVYDMWHSEEEVEMRKAR